MNYIVSLWNGFFQNLFFNKVILVLYFLNILNFAFRRQWPDMSYWVGAFWITFTVTFLYKH